MSSEFRPGGRDPFRIRMTLSQGSDIGYPAHQVFTLRFTAVANLQL